MGLAAATRRTLGTMLFATSCSATAQMPDWWRAALSPDVSSTAWVGVDASGFGPDDALVQLDVRRRATQGAGGYWVTHLRASYAASRIVQGVDGEDVRTAQVYVAILLDCDRGTWLLAGAYGEVAAGRELMLAPLQHTGLEATDVALDRITRLACRTRLAAETRTAPGGADLVDLRAP